MSIIDDFWVRYAVKILSCIFKSLNSSNGASFMISTCQLTGTSNETFFESCKSLTKYVNPFATPLLQLKEVPCGFNNAVF